MVLLLSIFHYLHLLNDVYYFGLLISFGINFFTIALAVKYSWKLKWRNS